MTATAPPLAAAAIIDVESSGLGPDSYPVSVAWRHFGRQGAEGHVLVRPDPIWGGEWQAEAEAIHGITREQLRRDGLDPAEAAVRIAEGLAGATPFSDAPALDQRWLDMIFARAAARSGLLTPAVRRLATLFPGADRTTITTFMARAAEAEQAVMGCEE